MRQLPQRDSRLALWSKRLALFAGPVVAAGVVLGRTGIIMPIPAVAVLGAGLCVAALAVLLALTAYVDIWRSGAVGLVRANVGLLLGLAIIAWPAFVIARAYRLPAIHDISTDLREPPAFSRTRAAMDARGGYVPAEATPDVREQQRKAYPDAVPIVLELGPEETYQLVLQAAQQMRWRIIDRAPPSVRSGAARIDAIDRTSIMRFSDDITIRIRPLANQTRVDIRSASRIGSHDLGTNAARIRTFSDILIDLNKGA